MPKHTFLVEPHEMIHFAMNEMGLDHNDAYYAIDLIAPECEVRTKDFTEEEALKSIQKNMTYGETEQSLGIKAYRIVIAFLKHYNVERCTMIQ